MFLLQLWPQILSLYFSFKFKPYELFHTLIVSFNLNVLSCYFCTILNKMDKQMSGTQSSSFSCFILKFPHFPSSQMPLPWFTCVQLALVKFVCVSVVSRVFPPCMCNGTVFWRHFIFSSPSGVWIIFLVSTVFCKCFGH